MNARRPITTLFVSLILLLMQTVSVVHAAEHAFHEEDEYCGIMQAVEKHDSSEIVAHAAPIVSRYLIDRDHVPYQHFAATTTRHHLPRAPPAG